MTAAAGATILRGMSVRDMALAVAVVMIWAFTVVAAKAGVAQLPPMLLLACRMGLAGLVVVWFVPLPPRRDFPQLLLLAAILGPLHFGLTIVAVQYIDAGTATIGLQTMAPFAALLAWIVFGDAFGWRRAAGMGLAFAGVVLVAGAPTVAGRWHGVAIILVSAFFFAVYNVLVRRLRPANPAMVNAWVALLSAVLALAASLAFESGQAAALHAADWEACGSIVYQGIVATLLGHTLWIRLIGRNGTNLTMPFTLLMPGFGVVFAVIYFGDPVSWQSLAGGAVTVAGVALIILKPGALRPRKARSGHA
ncbi:MAG: DMT family transporter [Rhodospirillales bacterium]